MPVSRLRRCGHFVLRLAIATVLVTAWLPAVDAQQRPRTAWATGFSVTSLSDPGIGSCDLDECTLREAILAANDSAGADWIKLAVNGTITLTSELPTITDELTIDGTDRTLMVDGAGAFRVFSTTAPVTLTSLTVQNGLAPNANGGGAYFGSTAVLTDVIFRNNTTAGFNLGGGAFFAGPAYVTGSTFDNNRSGNAGGGGYFQSTAVVSDTTFITNTATLGAGGGAYFEQGASVTHTDFVDNAGNSSGGGAHFGQTSILTNVRFLGNRSRAGYGGGASLSGTGSVLAGNVFDGNSANTNGGGLALIDFGTGSSAALTANSIWHNASENDGGGIYLGPGTSATLDNNVIAANTVLEPAAGAEISVVGANTQLTGRHNSLASAAPDSGTALSAGADGVGQTVALTNTIFDGYAVGVATGSFTPTVNLDRVLWSSVTTPTQGAGVTVIGATDGSAAFTNPILRNYHLTSASDAIDEGLNTGLNIDFEGDLRSGDLAPDLGADEYIGVPQAPPDAIDDSASTLEDTPVTVPVLVNDTDPNNDTLILGGVGLPNFGQATLSGTIAIVYTPTLNFTGTAVFTYDVTDNVFTSTATVTVTITPVNDPPTISDVSDITLTVSPSTGALPFTVGDVESGGAVTVTAQSNNVTLVPNGNIMLSGSGVNRTVTVTPAAGQSGQVTITLTVYDNHAAMAQSSFVVVVYKRVLLPVVRR